MPLSARRTPTIEDELSHLACALSHDVGVPLRAISSFASILLESNGDALGEDRARMLSVVRAESQRLTAMIEGMTQYCRAGSQPIRYLPFEMATLARMSAKRQAMLAAYMVNIRITALPAATGDPTLLAEVWDRLIDNAIKFSSIRKEIVVDIEGACADGMVTYQISDNGTGFDERYTDGLFSLFGRLHRPDEFPGIGVGLAVARRIIERHRGEIWANAKPGEGATFQFSLPSEGS